MSHLQLCSSSTGFSLGTDVESQGTNLVIEKSGNFVNGQGKDAYHSSCAAVVYFC